jgi:hypothetical protein
MCLLLWLIPLPVLSKVVMVAPPRKADLVLSAIIATMLNTLLQVSSSYIANVEQTAPPAIESITSTSNPWAPLAQPTIFHGLCMWDEERHALVLLLRECSKYIEMNSIPLPAVSHNARLFVLQVRVRSLWPNLYQVQAKLDLSVKAVLKACITKKG